MVSSSSRIVMTLLGTGVSAFILSAHLAQAATGSFSPSGAWSINRVDPSNGSASYCTLARGFTGNTVITFARNTGGEGTIAIDFKQSLFDPGQTYRIGLQAGEGIKREFMTRPATAGALVLRTGEDAAFFAALGNSTELGVIMDGTRYAFSLPDFGDGVSKLNNCISTSPASPSAPAASPVLPVAAAPLAPESPELRAMRAELDKLRSENDSIVSALKTESSTRASTTTSSESAELVARVQALETEKNQLVERLQSNQKNDLRDLSELRVALEEQKNLRTMLQSEREQRERLESSLGAKTAEAEQRGELRARINLLESSNTELKSLRASLDTERKKREQAESAAALGLEEQERLRARLSELETQNKTLSADAARFATVRSELEDVSKLAEQERARREATEAALKTSQMAIASRETELSVLQTRLENERSKLEAAQKTQQDTLTREHQAEVNRLQAQMRNLQNAEEQAQNEQARRAAAENTVREMQGQMADLEKQLVTARENKQSQAEINRLQARLNDLQNAQEQAQNEQARRAAAENTVREMQSQMADLEKQLVTARENKQSQAEINRLQTRLNDLQDAQNNATTETARRTAAENTVREMQSQMAAREGAITDLQKQLSNARENKEGQAELARLQNRITELQAMQSDASAETARRAAAENTVREMQGQIATLETQLQTAQKTQQNNTEVARLQTELETLRATRNDAQTRLETETARRIASEQTIATLQKQIVTPDNSNTAKLATRLAAMEDHNNELMQRLRDAQNKPNNTGEVQELRTMLEAETARRKQAESAFATANTTGERDAVLNKRIAELETRNAELNTRLNAAPKTDDSQAEALRRQLSVLQQDNEQLATRLANVANQPVPAAVTAGRVVYTGGDAQMAENLAETQASLESVTAERNEYRNLLQRERAQQTRAEVAASSTPAANARITALEAERVDLIRQLEFERARLSEMAAGREAPPSAAEARLSERLTALESEKAALQKQLHVTQQDVIAARNVSRTPDTDVSELLLENRRLQAELASSANRANPDVNALQGEIATLRAQNQMLNDEVTRRLAAAPDRAQIDNANARADHAAQAVQAQMSGALNTAQARFEQAEAENIRLARELATSRATAAQEQARAAAAQEQTRVVAVQEQVRVVSTPDPAQARFEQAEAENIRLARELAATRAAVQTPTAQPAVAHVPAIPQVVVQQPAQAPASPPIVVAAAQPRAAAISRPIVDTPSDAGQGTSQYAGAPVYQQASVPVSAPSMDPYANAGPDGRVISSYLQRAGVPMVSGFEKIARVSTGDFAAFRWDTGVVFGTAEQKIAHASGADTAMNEYLQKTRNRCSGTYDQSISKVGNVTTADVACIMPDGNGAGAAVVFFYKDGTFNVVAHEGTLDTFEQAMTTRDKFANFVGGL